MSKPRDPLPVSIFSPPAGKGKSYKLKLQEYLLVVVILGGVVAYLAYLAR